MVYVPWVNDMFMAGWNRILYQVTRSAVDSHVKFVYYHLSVLWNKFEVSTEVTPLNPDLFINIIKFHD